MKSKLESFEALNIQEFAPSELNSLRSGLESGEGGGEDGILRAFQRSEKKFIFSKESLHRVTAEAIPQCFRS